MKKEATRMATTGKPITSRTAAADRAGQQHTPGPWDTFGDEIVARNTDLHIADVALHDGINPTEWQANMRLIAAAPDLLEALRDLLNVIATDDLVPESVSYMQQARAALATAEGA